MRRWPSLFATSAQLFIGDSEAPVLGAQASCQKSMAGQAMPFVKG
jgi:hypothetical protein